MPSLVALSTLFHESRVAVDSTPLADGVKNGDLICAILDFGEPSPAPTPMPARRAALSEQAETLRAQGNAYFRDGDFLSAEARYTAALELDPQNPRVHCNRGMTVKALGAFTTYLSFVVSFSNEKS